MRSYVELIGHVARRPEIRLHANGDRHALMVVETREEWRDRNSGEQRSRSTWHDVKVTKAGLVKAIERQLTGGELVFVTGTLRYSDWVDGQNVQRRTSEVSVKAPEHHVLFLSKSPPDD
jgi:single-strand DNA-binding protein